MVSFTLTAALCLAAPIDVSRSYFPGLDRPPATRAQIGTDDGPIILVVVDALRPDHMSTYGAKRKTTPNLDALADDGIVFTNFFTNGNWTRPSTASLLSGQLPYRHRIERDSDRMSDTVEALPELMREAGYATGAVVGNGNAGSAFGLAQGFDYYADTVKHWKGLPSADDVIDLAIPFVDEHHNERFFLMLFLIDPHDPYHAPGEFETLYVTDEKTPIVRTPHWELGNYDEATVQKMVDVYDGAVRYTDHALGRFIGHLKSAGLYDKSTIVLTSDHGEAFGEHGVFLHAHHLYDEVIRAPLIVRAPKMSRRGVYNHYLTQTIDLLPTLVGAAGGRIPDEVQGVSLFDQLGKPGLVDANRVVVSEFSNFGIRRRTVRGYRHKVIVQLPADEDAFLATVGKKSLLPSVNFDGEDWAHYRIDKDPFERAPLRVNRRTKGSEWHRMERILRANESQRRASDKVHVVKSIDAETLGDLKSLGYIQ